MELKFPVLVREKDCGDVRKYSSILEMQYHFEKIDVENDEYEAWDANGVPLSLSVQEPMWLRVEASETPASADGLASAISKFAELQGLQVDLSRLSAGQFSAVLDEVGAAINRKWKSKTWWQRFKRRF